MYTKQDLKIMQGWSLEQKIRTTQTRIIEWYEYFNGQVYVAFSGGKDSSVLLDLARRTYPDIEAVFVDTGLEYPEIRSFVKTFDNVTRLEPEMYFNEVIKIYGYPIISKSIANCIRGARLGQKSRLKRLNGLMLMKDGNKSLFNCKKWNYLIDVPFKISEECCKIMKINPFKKYGKKANKYPIIGTTAEESLLRRKNWLSTGCNAFKTKDPHSQPLSFWVEQDILRYLKLTGIPYCKIYGDIIPEDGQLSLFDDNMKLKTTGERRTGCMFCMFGVHLEKSPNRFQRMKKTHPKQYDYCINKLGCGKALDCIGVKYD